MGPLSIKGPSQPCSAHRRIPTPSRCFGTRWRCLDGQDKHDDAYQNRGGYQCRQPNANWYGVRRTAGLSPTSRQIGPVPLRRRQAAQVRLSARPSSKGARIPVRTRVARASGTAGDANGETRLTDASEGWIPVATAAPVGFRKTAVYGSISGSGRCRFGASARPGLGTSWAAAAPTVLMLVRSRRRCDPGG